MTGQETLDLLLRGIAAGAQLALGLSLARGARNRALSLATILFVGANLAFVMNDSSAIMRPFGAVRDVFWLIQIGSAGLFWLFAVVLFEDRRLDLRAFAPTIGLMVLGMAARFAPAAVTPWLWVAHNVAGLAVSLHAMLLILRSGRADLVEARRRLRVPFLALVASYSVAVSAAQIALLAGVRLSGLSLVNAAAQAMLGLAGACVLLEARAAIFGRAEPLVSPGPAPDPDLPWLDRLHGLMESERLWQREGLTIGDLAIKVGLPEHRLRRLINDRLGHRNFAAFINQQRIAAAQRALADPAASGRTVASIAYDLGFGSLGPFNRAFRDATGVTPPNFVAASPGILADFPKSFLISETARFSGSRRDGTSPVTPNPVPSTLARGPPMTVSDLLPLGNHWLLMTLGDVIRYVIFATGVWALLWILLRRPLAGRQIRSTRPPARQLVSEFIYSIRAIAIFSTVSLVPAVALKAGWINGDHLAKSLGPIWFWASLVLMIVAHDTYFYWVHRLAHRRGLFRWIHRRHHLSSNPSPFTAYSFDVAEAVLMGSFVPLWVLIVPTQWVVVDLFVLHQIVRNTLLHCGIEVMPARRDGRPLLDWLTTTTHHDLHHGRMGWNFALYFTWWDRWMGTEHPDYHARFAAAVRRAAIPAATPA